MTKKHPKPESICPKCRKPNGWFDEVGESGALCIDCAQPITQPKCNPEAESQNLMRETMIDMSDSVKSKGMMVSVGCPCACHAIPPKGSCWCRCNRQPEADWNANVTPPKISISTENLDPIYKQILKEPPKGYHWEYSQEGWEAVKNTQPSQHKAEKCDCWCHATDKVCTCCERDPNFKDTPPPQEHLTQPK